METQWANGAKMIIGVGRGGGGGGPGGPGGPGPPII